MADPMGVAGLLIAAATLAHNTYRKCRDSRGQYQLLCDDSNALRIVLENLSDLAEKHTFTGDNHDQLRRLALDCLSLLEEIKATVDRFQSLGQPGQRVVTWNGFKFDAEAAKEQRLRLSAIVARVTNFYSQLMVSSQVRVEQALQDLREEIRCRRRSPKSVSRYTSADEPGKELAWPDVVQDLEDVGLDKGTAEKNRRMIGDWLYEKRDDFPDDSDDEDDNDEAPDQFRLEAFTVSTPPGGESTPSLPPAASPLTPATSLYGGSSHGRPSSDLTFEQSQTFQRYMQPHGDGGALVAEQVRKNKNTFRDDLNRAREYWKRQQWSEVMENLLRVLVATQLPRYRTSDISARAAAFLLGVAYKNSGDLEMAKNIMLSVLNPVPEDASDAGMGGDPQLGPYDDGQIAAATWLGDLCFKTNSIECAALAWALAYDAALRKSQRLERTTGMGAHHVAGVTSSPSLPATPQLGFGRPSSLLLAPQTFESQTRVLLFRLAFADERTACLRSLHEALYSNMDPDGDDSIFSDSAVISKTQMYRIADQALNAVNRASSSVLNDEKESRQVHMQRTLIVSGPHGPSQGSLDDASGRSFSGPVPADEYLQSPVRTKDRWPLEYDAEFSMASAVRLIDWFFNFTPLDRETILHDLPILDAKSLREHKSMILVDSLDLKQADRFVHDLKRVIDLIGFEQREEPGGLRCRNKGQSCSSYANIACFGIRIIKYKPEKVLGWNAKLAASLSHVVFWNGEIERMVAHHQITTTLLVDMKTKLKLLDTQRRGMLLYSTHSRPGGSFHT